MEEAQPRIEFLPTSERIRELEEEVRRLKGSGGGTENALLRLMQNPEGLQQQFNLSPEQALNVRAILAGGGTALAIRYLGPMVGEQLAGAIAGYLMPILARRVIGG